MAATQRAAKRPRVQRERLRPEQRELLRDDGSYDERRIRETLQVSMHGAEISWIGWRIGTGPRVIDGYHFIPWRLELETLGTLADEFNDCLEPGEPLVTPLHLRLAGMRCLEPNSQGRGGKRILLWPTGEFKVWSWSRAAEQVMRDEAFCAALERVRQQDVLAALKDVGPDVKQRGREDARAECERQAIARAEEVVEAAGADAGPGIPWLSWSEPGDFKRAIECLEQHTQDYKRKWGLRDG